MAARQDKHTDLSALSFATVGRNIVGEQRPGIETIARNAKLIRLACRGETIKWKMSRGQLSRSETIEGGGVQGGIIGTK